ncbi:MAG: DUF2723 domain-containing protein [Candidatus Eisenbacteria bacterium]
MSEERRERPAAEKTPATEPARPAEEKHDGSITYGSRFDWAVAAAVVLVSGIVYYMTAGRGAPFWDCGEFIACAYILGIPHPPGAALFVMTGRVVSLIPFLDTAFLLNLFSGLCSALAVGFCSLALSRVVRRLRGREASMTDRVVLYAGSILGSLCMAFGSTYWFNAVEAEVYGLTLLLVSLLIWLTVLWYERARTPEGNRILILQTYLLFLGATNHMQSFLPIIPLFLLVFMVDRSRLKSPVFWAVFLVLTAVIHSTSQFLFGTPIACALFFVAMFSSRYSDSRRDYAIIILSLVVGVVLYYMGGMKVAAAVGGAVLVLGAVMVRSPGSAKAYTLAGSLLLAAMLGYSLYAYVPIRAAENPAINENHPKDWKNFKMFLERKQYSDKSMFELMFTRKGTWGNQFGDFHRIGFWYHLKDQWLPHRNYGLYLFIPLLTLGGVWALWKRDRKIGLYFLGSLLLFTVAMTLYLNFSDDTKGVKLEVRDRDYFYTPGFVMIAYMTGIGFSWLLGVILSARFGSRALRESVVAGLAIISLAVPITTVKAKFYEHDRSRFWVAEDLAYNMLVGLRENAILFTGGDNDTFPLWYIQEVRGFRKDVRIVNLSLLNTPWYIKQLKYEDPKVAIPLNDQEIEGLRGYYSPGGEIVTIKDIVMPLIIRDNIKNRAVYYAITVPTSDQGAVQKKLIQEGLVKRIEPDLEEESINVKEMEKNFGEGQYRFRGLDDPTVYKDRDTRRLLTNYNACLYNLAQLFQRAGEPEKAQKYIAMLRSWPHDNMAGNRMLALLAEGQQDWEMALQYIGRCRELEPADGLNYVKEAEYLRKLERTDEAIDLILEARRFLPEDRTVLGAVIRTLTGTNREGEITSHLEDWVSRHPEDEGVKQALQTYYRGAGD